MLTVADLTKHFDAAPVLDGFSFTLPRNGFTVLIGPSGCGKTTLFDVLTGVVPKDGGTIRWNGRELGHLGTVAAYMQQKDLLLPWLTLAENALLPASLRREKHMAAARERVKSLFARLGLAGFEDHRPATVSGGMRQRCALVRTLMFDRELTLLDEPLSALDAITRRSLQSLLLMLQRDFRRTLLMITHDVEEALLLADRVLVVSAAPMRIIQDLALPTQKPRRPDNPALIALKETVLARLEGELDHGVA
ncbi:MAG TPA: ABC transporter ATP-binding protein [Desulfobacteraceae bacterium]|nr:ABC transporter ATP-binding protein [Deltaproteobacteria bacterium]HDI60383.1 ABC transporter ATP-binding protein [Desulfobacteraceae bacterium]